MIADQPHAHASDAVGGFVQAGMAMAFRQFRETVERRNVTQFFHNSLSIFPIPALVLIDTFVQ